MLLSALLALALTTTSERNVLADPALKKHVTYSTRATDARTVLAGLTKASDVKLVDSQQGRPAILLLKLKDVPLADVMARIANATGESWIKDHDSFKLVTTEEDTRRARDAANAAERPAVIAAVQEAGKQTADAMEFTPAVALALAGTLKNDAFIPQGGGSFGFNNVAIERVRTQQPIGRLMNSIVARLAPDLILAQPFCVRTVFSTGPNEMELQLPLDVAPGWASFVKAQNVWADAVNSLGAAPRGMIMEGNFVDRIDPQGLKLDVVIDRTRQLGGDAVELELVTTTGAVVASDRTTFNPVPAKLAGTPAIDAAQRGIVLTEDERTEVRRLLDGSGMQTGQIPLPEELRKRIEHPEMFEPLATFVSSILLQTAEPKGQNIVACVPDRWLQVGAEAIDSTATKPMSWVASVSLLTGVATSADEKWIEVDGQTKAPQSAGDVRADRRLLAALLASGNSGQFSPEAIGRYAIDAGERNADALFAARVGVSWITDPAARQALRPLAGAGARPTRVRRGLVAVDNDTWNVLRIIGGMAERQATPQVTPQELGFDKLDENLRVVAKDAVFYEGGILRRPEMSAEGRMQLNEFEPFDLFPHGLPATGVLTLSVSNDSVVVDDLGGAVTPNEVARNTFSVTHGTGRSGGPTTSNKFRLGSQREIGVQLDLAPGAGWNGSYLEVKPTSGEPIAFESLPDSFVRRVRADLARLEQSPRTNLDRPQMAANRGRNTRLHSGTCSNFLMRHCRNRLPRFGRM